MARPIVSHTGLSSDKIAGNFAEENPELRHYRFQQSLWNKILNTNDFNSFDENEYFRLLEIYKDDRQTPDLLIAGRVSLEQKLAIIEAIQLRSFSKREHPALLQKIEQLNAYQLRKLQKLLSKFDLTQKTTRQNLEEFTTEFFLILRGAPISVLDYFSVKKTKGMNERLLRTLEEDMLIRGLKNTIDRLPPAPFAAHESLKERGQALIKKVMKFKAWRLLALPYDLPWIDRIKVSDQLLEKILNDGLDAHQSELIVELKNQNAIDHYERFRKVYRPVAFGTGLYFLIQNYKDKEESENTEAKEKFLEEFKKLAEALEGVETKEKTDEDLKEEQFQRVLKAFREKYKSEPTALEYRELRKKIFGSDRV